MAQVFRVIHGYDRVDPGKWFTQVNNERVTRRGADPLRLAVGLSRPDLRQNFFSQCVTEHWNAVPAELSWQDLFFFI